LSTNGGGRLVKKVKSSQIWHRDGEPGVLRRKDVKRLIYLHIHRIGGTTLRHEIMYNCDRSPQNLFLSGRRGADSLRIGGGAFGHAPAEQEKLEVIVRPFGLREHLPGPESWMLLLTRPYGVVERF
jgi:hypothetical protein